MVPPPPSLPSIPFDPTLAVRLSQVLEGNRGSCLRTHKLLYNHYLWEQSRPIVVQSDAPDGLLARGNEPCVRKPAGGGPFFCVGSTIACSMVGTITRVLVLVITTMGIQYNH